MLKLAHKLTYKARENLGAGAFVFPGERRYPIHDQAHARNALARASGKAEESTVRRAVHAKFPGIGKTARPVVVDDELLRQAMQELAGEASMAWDPLPSSQVFDADAALRAVGGAMTRLKVKTAAFHKITMAAFANELEGISKEGAFMTNVSAPIKSTVGSWFQKQLTNTAAAAKDHLLPLEKMRESWREAKWMGEGAKTRYLPVGMKTFTLAGAGLSAADVAPKEDMTGQNRGRGQRLGNALASTASGLITMKHGLIPATATGLAAGYVGGKVGKLFDRKKALPKQQDQAPRAPAQQTAE